VIVCRGWRASQLDLERHLRRLLRYLEVDCVLDVGANSGQFADMLRSTVGYAGLIISFEPNPEQFIELRARASRDPLWQAVPQALGREAGEAEFNVYASSELSSLRSLDPGAGHQPADPVARQIRVDVRTLAECLPELQERYGFSRPFLKMDTQGFDVEIAKGAGSRLTDFVGLQSEVAFQRLYQGAPDFQSALAFYEASGFVLARLTPVHELHFPELVEMDCVMVRKDLVRP
jgi:FkbM family methyltransferase